MNTANNEIMDKYKVLDKFPEWSTYSSLTWEVQGKRVQIPEYYILELQDLFSPYYHKLDNEKFAKAWEEHIWDEKELEQYELTDGDINLFGEYLVEALPIEFLWQYVSEEAWEEAHSVARSIWDSVETEPSLKQTYNDINFASPNEFEKLRWVVCQELIESARLMGEHYERLNLTGLVYDVLNGEQLA